MLSIGLSQSALYRVGIFFTILLCLEKNFNIISELCGRSNKLILGIRGVWLTTIWSNKKWGLAEKREVRGLDLLGIASTL